MPVDQERSLSKEETNSFLGRHETGVLSLARDGEPYSVPMSYGYDPERRRFYFRVVSAPESEKRRFLTSNPQARLVVYEEDGPIYRSVVATGTLQEISRDELTVEHIEQYGSAKRPLFELWEESCQDLEINLYQLDAAEIRGREIEIDQPVDPAPPE
jgi:hypothetical protein